MPSNDNTPDNNVGRSPVGVDAHGQAALLLVESLIHGMIERAMLNTADAIEIIDIAIEIQGLIAEAADDEGTTMWEAQSVLQRMSSSLAIDVGEAPTHIG